MSKSEVDLLSLDEALMSESDNIDSEEDDDLPLTELKKKNNSTKKLAQVILKHMHLFSCYCFLRIISALSKLN